MKSRLPSDWATSPLGDLASAIQYGYTEKAQQEKVGPRFLRITDIQNDSVNWNEVPFCVIDEKDKKKYLLRQGDLVFARTGATVGKSFLITGSIPESVFASYLIRVRLRADIEPKYVSYFFRSNDYWRQISESQAGIGQPNVNGKKLAQIQIPVAPLDQQKRIVAEIEKQFSRVDEAVANLKRVKANLKRYKAAVLKAAVEGRLVETEAELARREGRSFETGAQLLQRILETRRSQWQGKGKYKESAAPDTTDLPELPEEWIWASFDQACEAVSDEGKKIARSEYLADGALPVVDQGESEIGGYTDKTELSYTGQLPVIAFGDHTRRFKLVFAPFVVGADGVKLIGIGPAWIPSFLWFQFQTLNFEDRGYSRHFQFVRNKPLRIAPLNEQLRIVTEVDRRLSLIRETEAQVNANMQRAERLRQSILSKAFTGNMQ